MNTPAPPLKEVLVALVVATVVVVAAVTATLRWLRRRLVGEAERR